MAYMILGCLEFRPLRSPSLCPPPAGAPAPEPLYTGAEWDFQTLRRIHDACEEIALGEMGLSVYPNRIEVISAEQMLDAYASVGLPLFYRHWSFGKDRKSTRLNSSHANISYAVFCLKKKKNNQ